MRQLRGKWALVTGAASGIGRAIAVQLAEEGMRLYLIDVDQVGLARVAMELRSKSVEVVERRCDLTSPAEVSDAAADALQCSGGIDLLVNNAGITYYGRTTEMSAEHWDRLMAVNLHAPVQLTRELLPSMLARDEAHVLNVASICGLVGLGRVAAYTTSKFALVGFSESLRAEYGRQGLGVTALCPGLVDTNLFTTAPRGKDRAENKTPPRWLLATPERIARRAVRAVRRNERAVVLQPYARLLHAVKRWAPGLLDRINTFRRRRRPTPQSAPRRAA